MLLRLSTGRLKTLAAKTRPLRAVLAAGSAVAAVMCVSAAHADPLAMPAMGPTLSANPSPTTVDTGPLGTVYVTGAVSGLAYAQNHEASSDMGARGDVSNAQVFLQTTEGPVQFFVQVGAYSIPTVGVPYGKSSDITQDTYGVVPQAYVKIAPADNLSIMAGKLPTLIGSEYTFTFQNMNIQRGMLWNQENAVNRGVQVNYSTGKLSASFSVNDGFYSNKYSWVSGLVSYAFDASNVLTLAGGGNTSHSGRAGTATPLAQNNSEIYNVIYTYTNGPLTVSPYFQYSTIHDEPGLGLKGAKTYGYALLGKYGFTENFSLAGRAEYIDSTGDADAANLVYGPGSNAWSLTLTPTFQFGRAFVRGELSYVKVDKTGPGFAFGSNGDERSQTRALIETGILF
ncbi:outer membrane beta-barrel protein [Caulobacter segnis]|uniref:outer membrane beta-barrel protein n=1 Tax=Caulobacter segnis TaxID=88688 RepID=UPI00240F8BA1|nr:outer membrane beta-barrel protein [Caulobacter segnis]MDG2522206.1 outer membrane beta-barrel protein [Caulobacter segnis]